MGHTCMTDFRAKETYRPLHLWHPCRPSRPCIGAMREIPTSCFHLRVNMCAAPRREGQSTTMVWILGGSGPTLAPCRLNSTKHGRTRANLSERRHNFGPTSAEISRTRTLRPRDVGPNVGTIGPRGGLGLSTVAKSEECLFFSRSTNTRRLSPRGLGRRARCRQPVHQPRDVPARARGRRTAGARRSLGLAPRT